MPFLDALMPRAETPAPTDDFWYTDYPVRAGGTDVTPDTAQKVTAVYACIQVRCETLAALPLHLMRREGRNRYPATEHPLYDVLHSRPNSWQTKVEFCEMMEGHVGLRGNAYAQIIPGPRGAVDQLIPLHPGRMDVFLLENRRLGYLYRDLQGVQYRLTQDEVFHLRLRSSNGFLGMSPIALARRAVELAMTAEEHGVRYMQNAGEPSGVIQMGPGFHFEDESHARRLGKSWRDAHTGKDLYTVAFLEDGAEWHQVGLSNTDSQWLESRTFQLGEIARIFRVPVFLIGGSLAGSSSMYSNVEQSDMHLVKHTMLPIIAKWEQAIGRDLITDPALYAKFSVEGLLRADSKSQAIVFKMLKEMGALSVNEIRELLDRNPIEGGDEYKVASPPALPPPGKQDGDEPAGGDGASLDRLVLRDAEHFWIVDAAKRIASAEIHALESRADKAAADRERFDTWVRQHWGGKVQEYAERTLSPIVAARNQAAKKSLIDVAGLVGGMCMMAVAQLTTGDPVEVLEAWKAGRANEITKLLIGDLSDDE